MTTVVNFTDMEANKLKEIVLKRTLLKPNELVCPREKSDMTPCVVRDGDIAMLDDEKKCVGCGAIVTELLEHERNR